LTTATAASVTSISLTAGDWDVAGAVRFVGAGSTQITDTFALISMTSLNLSQTDFSTCSHSRHQLTYAVGASATEMPARLRLSLNAATTVYLTVFCQFSVSTCVAIGILRARRIR
jgi:hypothetical protein